MWIKAAVAPDTIISASKDLNITKQEYLYE